MTKQSFKKSSQWKGLGRKGRGTEGVAYWGEEAGNNDAIVAVELMKVREDKL